MNTIPGHFLQPYLDHWLPILYTRGQGWTLVGFAGNLLFSSRFIFQWIASERRQKLFVPEHFWQLSFWGSVINLIYALHIDNAPILMGTLALPFIYGRNLVLLRRSKEQKPVPSKPALRASFGSA